MTRRLLALLCVATATACGANEKPDAGGGPPDAGVSSCGIVGADSECTGETALRRCQGTQAVSETCGIGLVCGTDPATGKGATCQSPDAACGAIDDGVCSGPILSACVDGRILTIDCARHHATCSGPGAAVCTTPCLEANVTALGRCEGNAIRRCSFADGAYFVELAACPSGTTCASSNPDSRQTACVPSPSCSGLGPVGRCDGETVVRCVSGQRVETDCAASGEVCTFEGDAYACAPSGEAGARVVSGAVRFERRVFDGQELGPLVTRPARSAAVVLIDDASGAPLASGATDDEGRYRLRHDAAAGAAVHVLVVAVSVAAARPVRVLRPDGLLHGFAAPTIGAAAEATVDVLITDRSGASPVFSILDVLIAGQDVVHDALDVAAPVLVTAVYAKGLEEFTNAEGNTMTILGSVEDDDGYDDAVLLHELGHVVENAYGRTSSTGGNHSFYEATDPRLAWSEGFATYFGSVVRDDPTYVDTRIDGAVSVDTDVDVTRANATRPMSQPIAEATVSQILWDLGDGGDGDDDASPGPHPPVLRVQDMVLRAAAADRGTAGVDLVDFLDGYLLLGGQEICDATRDVVESRTFPYDFAGPVRCP